MLTDDLKKARNLVRDLETAYHGIGYAAIGCPSAQFPALRATSDAVYAHLLTARADLARLESMSGQYDPYALNAALGQRTGY